jgi:uncharacterized membrane protein YdbT with pleckstrin-like domain
MVSTYKSAGIAGKWKRIAASASGEGVVAPEIAATMVPEQMLHEDEEILLLVKPSPMFILLTSFRFMLMSLVAAVIAVRWIDASYASPNNIALIASGLALIRLVWGLLVWTSHTYMLTNKRIITIKGVVNISVVATNLRKVQRTTLYMPWWLRIFGLGTVGIATAATDTYDATWVMVARPVYVHETIVTAIRKIQG